MVTARWGKLFYGLRCFLTTFLAFGWWKLVLFLINRIQNVSISHKILILTQRWVKTNCCGKRLISQVKAMSLWTCNFLISPPSCSSVTQSRQTVLLCKSSHSQNPHLLQRVDMRIKASRCVYFQHSFGHRLDLYACSLKVFVFVLEYF